jgi:transposase
VRRESEAEIIALTERDKALKAGVDRLTAITVLCETNGFLLIHNIRQAVSHAGPDVEMKESGQYGGKTKITEKGNARIRECLFIPAFSAVNRNQDIKSLYDRIVEKNPAAKRKGAVAGMHKLPVLISVLWKKRDINESSRT